MGLAVELGVGDIPFGLETAGSRRCHCLGCEDVLSGRRAPHRSGTSPPAQTLLRQQGSQAERI